MINAEHQFFIEETWYKDELSIFYYQRMPDGKLGVPVVQMNLVDEEEAKNIASPIIRMCGRDKKALGELMDKLWNIGIRPSTQQDDNAISCVKYHLEDMRRLVFKESDE